MFDFSVFQLYQLSCRILEFETIMIFSSLKKNSPHPNKGGGEAVLAELKKLQLGQRIISTLDHIFKLISSQSATTFPGGWLD